MTDAKLYDNWYGFDWDMILYSWGTNPDPDFLLSTFTSGQCGYWSDTCYDNPEYDDLYREQQTTIDPEQRREVVIQMQQMLYEDSPEIVLWYPNGFEAWRSRPMDGFPPVARTGRRRVLGEHVLGPDRAPDRRCGPHVDGSRPYRMDVGTGVGAARWRASGSHRLDGGAAPMPTTSEEDR